MPIALVIIGAILIVAAFNGTHPQLAAALERDVPGYFAWGVAIAAVLAFGFVPGLRGPSRWLLALVITVIVLRNWQAIVSGFSQFAATGGSVAAAPSPVTAIAASPAIATAIEALNPTNLFAAFGAAAGA